MPEGWEELMDPMGNLYFYNEGTMQTTRQHPMDGCYLLWPYLLWPYLPWPTCHGSTHHGHSSYSFHVPWSYDLHTVAYLLWLCSTYYGRYYQSLYRKLRMQQKQGDGGGGRRPSMAAGAGRRN